MTAFAMAPAHAAPYPEKPLTLVVPYPAGGGLDVLGRLMAEGMSRELNVPVVVENRTGAGGTIGVSYVARSKPDGYTLLIASPAAISIAPSLYSKLPYQPLRDLAPVAMISQMPSLLVTNRSAPFSSVGELAEYGKANPGKLNYGSGEPGSSLHLSGAMFAQMAGFDATHIPYQGSAPAIVDLIGGQLDFMVVDTTAIAHVESGQLKLLAITNPERSAQLPDTPTIAEAGVPGYETINWYGLFLPAKTSPEIVQALNQVIQKVLADPSTQSRFKTLRADLPPALDSEAFTEFVRADTRKWDALVKSLNLSLD